MNAGIVDEDVQPSETVECFLQKSVDVFLRRDVPRDDQNAVVCEAACGIFELLPMPANEDDAGLLIEESGCRRPPNAGTGTSYDDDLL